MLNFYLEKIINEELDNNKIDDFVPNGLQIEGKTEVKSIITGVTACQALLDTAVSYNVDAILVHHGYFWKNEAIHIKGMKRRRIHTILVNDINLYSWHLPLDIHPTLGNNIQLGKLLDIDICGKITPLVYWGKLKNSLKNKELINYLSNKLNQKPIYCGDNNAPTKITRVAWCTGGGQNFIDDVVNFGNIDAYITGEVSEQTIHSAREQGIHFFAAGHHATEQGGIKALGEWLVDNYNLDVTFVNIHNPI